MTRTRLTLVVVSLVILSGLPSAQSVVSTTKAHVDVLASDKLEGREAGSEGERLAADYLATQLARIGARPLPVCSTFRPSTMTMSG